MVHFVKEPASEDYQSESSFPSWCGLCRSNEDICKTHGFNDEQSKSTREAEGRDQSHLLFRVRCAKILLEINVTQQHTTTRPC